MNILKQSTAATITAGPFLDDTDGKTAETGLSIATADVRISKNGGANAAKNSTTATSHNELGYYNIHLNATDTNTLGALKVMVSKEGALPVWADFMVVTSNVYDTFFSTGKFEVNLASGHGLMEADDYTAPDNASVTAIKGKTDNLPASPAATGDIPSDSDIATAVWGAVTRTLTSGIITAQDIWEHASRTLTESPTDVSDLPTKDDLDTAKDAIISAMPDIDISTIPDDILDTPIVGTLTVGQVLKVLAAIELGTVTGGGGTSFAYTGKDGTKVTLSGVDEDGNRTAVNAEFE